MHTRIFHSCCGARMLTYAHAYTYYDHMHTRIFNSCCGSRMLTYAHVCSRMLTQIRTRIVWIAHMAQLLLRASLTAAKAGPAMPQEDVRYTHTHTHSHTNTHTHTYTHTHTHTLSLSLTHTHTQKHTRGCRLLRGT